MLIKLGSDGLHWTKRPYGKRILAEERKRLDSRTKEVLKHIDTLIKKEVR